MIFRETGRPISEANSVPCSDGMWVECGANIGTFVGWKLYHIGKLGRQRGLRTIRDDVAVSIVSSR